MATTTAPDSAERIGFIGLGAMGVPMARRLVDAGYDVAVFDIDSRRVDALAEHGARSARSAGEAAAGAVAIFVMVATGAQLKAACTDGESGSIAGQGQTVIVSSTVGTDTVRDVEQAVRSRGARLLDAPVSGGPGRAEDGRLVIMAGGDQATFETSLPLLQHLATKVVHCGAVGAGQAVKLVNQLLAGVQIVAAAEALAYARALGVSPEVALAVVTQGAATSFLLEDRGPRMLTGAFSDASSAVDIFAKDMELVVAAAQRAHFETPLADVAHATYHAAAALGMGEMDAAAVIGLYEAGSEQPQGQGRRQRS